MQSYFLSFFVVSYFLDFPEDVAGVTDVLDMRFSWAVEVAFEVAFFVLSDVFARFFNSTAVVFFVSTVISLGVITYLLVVSYVSFFSALLSSGILISDFFGEGELWAVFYFFS